MIIFTLFPNEQMRVGDMPGMEMVVVIVLTINPPPKIIQIKIVPGFVINGRSSSPSYQSIRQIA
jgi:hypothetical protein